MSSEGPRARTLKPRLLGGATLVVVACGLLSGCTQGETEPNRTVAASETAAPSPRSPTPAAETDISGVWKVVGVDASDPFSALRLAIDDRSIVATLGCNDMVFSYEVSKNTVTTEFVSTTEALCSHLPEGELIDALNAAEGAAIVVSADELTVKIGDERYWLER